MGIAAAGSIVFDAYGTLFQTEPLHHLAEAIWPGEGDGLAGDWRRRQLRYSMALILTGRFEDFWRVTETALVDSVRALGLPLSATVRLRLLRAWLTLPPYPDAPRTLARLAARGRPLALLSEGTTGMLRAVVRRADLGRYLSALLSTEEARTYKPTAAAYSLVPQALGTAPADVWYVTAHDDWDLPGAAAAGFRTIWLNRRGGSRATFAPVPDQVVASLSDLIDV